MSSLRNAIKRVTHKERSQPQARNHLGLLEKKKDYKIRSKDYHSKADRLKTLKSKASQRNPDEFYFGMNNTEMKGGKHQRTEESRLKDLEESGMGNDAIKIMKDQDLRYVRLQRMRDESQVEKVQSTLHFLGEGEVKKKHSIFVGDEKEAERLDVSEYFGTVPELAGRAFNRPRLSTLLGKQGEAGEEELEEKKGKKMSEKQLLKQKKDEQKLAKRAAKERAKSYRELEARNKRREELEIAEAHLVTEKHLRGKGRKRKIKEADEDGRPAVYKWRRRRMT